MYVHVHFVVCTQKMIKPLLTIPPRSIYLIHLCKNICVHIISRSWQQQKIISKSLSNWYLAQADYREIIFNFLIVSGKKWSREHI